MKKAASDKLVQAASYAKEQIEKQKEEDGISEGEEYEDEECSEELQSPGSVDSPGVKKRKKKIVSAEKIQGTPEKEEKQETFLSNLISPGKESPEKAEPASPSITSLFSTFIQKEQPEISQEETADISEMEGRVSAYQEHIVANEQEIERLGRQVKELK